MPHKPHNFRALSKPKQLHKSEHRHYWPYIPTLLVVVMIFALSLSQPIAKHGVLSYATSMSGSALLDATNNERELNGAGDLKINSKLMLAAQAKANDMIARNYWSHTTPTGEAPWVFINNVGYQYIKAGENLAYGFSDSNGAVNGWMKSPSHRANLLDPTFTEVGFGYANGTNYHNDGAETVVVAMYGRPQTLAVSSASPSATTPKPAQSLPATTENKSGVEPTGQRIARVETVFGNNSWSVFGVGVLSGLAIMFLLAKHAVGLRHLLRNSERFVLHHPLLDTLLVSLVLVGSYLSQTTGFIR